MQQTLLDAGVFCVPVPLKIEILEIGFWKRGGGRKQLEMETYTLRQLDNRVGCERQKANKHLRYRMILRGRCDWIGVTSLINFYYLCMPHLHLFVCVGRLCCFFHRLLMCALSSGWMSQLTKIYYTTFSVRTFSIIHFHLPQNQFIRMQSTNCHFSLH